MKNSIRLPLLIIFALAAIVLLLILFLLGNQSQSTQACPEKWVKDTTQTPSLEYVIYEGGKKSLEEFDLNWVYANCTVVKDIIY